MKVSRILGAGEWGIFSTSDDEAGKNERIRQIQVLLMIFVFGGIFGFLYEELFYRIDLGYFVKRGTTFGPWIPIYGFGAVFIIAATRQIRKNPALVFVSAGVISGILEFITGYVCYHMFQLRLWDYNIEIWNWLNIGGYVCLRSVLFFAVSGILLCYLVLPIIERITRQLSPKSVTVVSVVPAALFVGDMIISFLHRI